MAKPRRAEEILCHRAPQIPHSGLIVVCFFSALDERFRVKAEFGHPGRAGTWWSGSGRSAPGNRGRSSVFAQVAAEFAGNMQTLASDVARSRMSARWLPSGKTMPDFGADAFDSTGGFRPDRSAC